MLPQSYKFSQGLFLDTFLQVLFIGNQRYQVTLFVYINRSGEVSCLFIRRKVLEDMKYLLRSVKRAAEAVEIWNE